MTLEGMINALCDIDERLSAEDAAFVDAMARAFGDAGEDGLSEAQRWRVESLHYHACHVGWLEGTEHAAAD